MAGIMVDIEGLDGSGKTTLIEKLSKKLDEKGIPHIVTREPGSTPICEDLRKLLKTKYRGDDLLPLSELLIFYAARHQHIETVIKPALARGEVVISDRFDLSTWAYQGAGRGLMDSVSLLSGLVLRDFKPDVIYYIDVPVDIAYSRMSARAEEECRIESAGEDFFNRVRDYYLETCQIDYPVICVDGIHSEITVFEDVWEDLSTKLAAAKLRGDINYGFT